MEILLLHPVSAWSLQRIAKVCQREAWKLTVITIHDSHVATDCASLHEWLRVDALTDEPETLMAQIGHRRFDAVVAGNEFAVVAADVLAKELGLYHNEPEKIRASRNKAAMRELFRHADLPQPHVLTRLTSLEECQAFDWSLIRFPVVIKPVDMAMSLFVRKCQNAEEVADTLERLLAFRQSRLTNYTFTPEALVEEFVDGPEYSLEAIISDGKLSAMYLTRKFVSPYPACYEIGHLSGIPVPEPFREELLLSCERIAHCWDMSWGVMHVELKISVDGVAIIEAAARPAGDHIPELVELRHGVSLEEAFLYSRLAQSPPHRSHPDKTGGIGIRFEFSERKHRAPTESMTVIECENHPDAVLPGAELFSVNRRTGFTIVRSDSFDELSTYLGAL
ncbi:ATP-grasp domain-containing protein [Pantoea ananatis]|uniref:ATP-grasp domain-containing protein n=1 Tax=Pantoea ananas TaxID=553 RepID=UPI00099D725D|nr:ATP-grasp domain-containing protein [Pantoea ananatis]SKA70746.1 ATP-grasp domain-containing protein [Pantoea ananatis]